VLTEKVAVLLPEATVTELGTVTELLELLRLMTIPPDPAGAVRVTVPIAELPPIIGFGLITIDRNVVELIVNAADWLVPLYPALIVAPVCVATAVVDTVKFAIVCPAGTVTDAGTLAAELLLVSATFAPPDGATPFKVTVPVDIPPFQTVDGLRTSDPMIVGWTVSVAETVFAKAAEIVAVDWEVMPCVVTVKVALVCPAAMLTVLGTTAKEPLLVKLISTPAGGAGDAKVTVPVDDVPPATVVGSSVNDEITGSVIVSTADTVLPPAVAEIVALVSPETAKVVTVKVVDVCPAATVTTAGTCAEEALLVSPTSAPPAGAGWLKVTVPVEFVPAGTVVGLSVKDDGGTNPAVLQNA